MANTIKLKRGAASSVGAASLSAGEPAFDLTNGILYIGNGSGKIAINPISSGSWTPTVACAKSYTVQTGYYTKIGRHVLLYCKLTFVSDGDTEGGEFVISGLPYSAAYAAAAPLADFTGNVFNATCLTAVIATGGSTISIMSIYSGLTQIVTNSHDDMSVKGAAVTLEFTLDYMTAS